MPKKDNKTEKNSYFNDRSLSLERMQNTQSYKV